MQKLALLSIMFLATLASERLVLVPAVSIAWRSTCTALLAFQHRAHPPRTQEQGNLHRHPRSVPLLQNLPTSPPPQNLRRSQWRRQQKSQQRSRRVNGASYRCCPQFQFWQAVLLLTSASQHDIEKYAGSWCSTSSSSTLGRRDVESARPHDYMRRLVASAE